MTHDHGMRVKAALAELGSSKVEAEPRTPWAIYAAMVLGLACLAVAAGIWL